MDAQEPRIEDRVTRGDFVGAIIAGAICLAAVALGVTFITNQRDRPSAVTPFTGGEGLGPDHQGSRNEPALAGWRAQPTGRGRQWASE
jgi:hypothetical protein